jgi:subtilase family serine protease
MIRRVSVFLLALVAIVTAVNLVCQAESQSLLKPNVQQVVLNGEAKLVGRLPATQTIHFDIVLALRHQPELENFLQQVYDPTSPSYRHFVTVKEFTERFGPSQEDFDAAVAFAKASGFTVVGGSRDGFDLQLTGSVANIEKAFNVSMGEYQHPTENRTFYSPDREPTVDLSVSLQHITGLDNYSLPHPLFQHKENKVHANATTGSCPDQSFCGSDMRAAYYESNALTGAGQNIGLLEFAGFDITDVNTYYQGAKQTYTFTVTGISTDGTSINCLASQGCDDTEQTIDITQAGGMAPGVSTIYVYVGSSDTAILSGMSSDTPLPLNLSSSWSWNTNPNGDDPYFEKMAAQGQTFFQAAGDGGGYTHQAPWPMNSQYTIPVGGTDLTTSGAGGPWASETVWEDGGAGWGSNVDIPSWQVAAATQCANEGGQCSTTFRDVPDVAANSNFSFYVCADQSGLSGCTANEYGGTSFAAPMWAGYIALTNQQAAANDDTPPGFLDPTIYPLNLGNGDIYFHDITSDANGSNGFPCVAGYNMCGGWGSPNGAGLITALAPTGPSFALSANPSSVSVTQGGQVATTITVTPEDGFSGSVTLSASGLPNGVTANFNPNPTTGTSTLTFTASATATTGTASVTVQGVSGSLTSSTLVSLTVNPLVQSFTLSASPSSVAIAKGGASGTSTITITPVNGFSGSVTLSNSALPRGVTAQFSPNPATSTSVLTLTAAKTAKVGTSTITITGTSGSLKATTTLTLTVNALGSFTLSASPSSLSVAQGGTGASTITVNPTDGFDQEVTLSAVDLPTGVTASFSPNPTTSTSTLTLTVGNGAATGKSTITIEGTSGTITKKTKVKLTVVAP